MSYRRVIAATALLLASAPALAQDTPEANWQKIVSCAAETSEDRRHDCMDRVLEESGVLDSGARAAAAAQDTRETFGLSGVQQDAVRRAARGATPEPAPPASPAAPAIAAAPTPGRPVEPSAMALMNSVTTSISKAFDPGNKLMVFMTAESQIWQQTERKDIGLPPRAGTVFTIERAALGGFICKVGNSRTFRCRRQA